MKHAYFLTQFKPRIKGMALVIVLAILALLTILAVGFLSRSAMERTSSAAYFEGNRASSFADIAVNIVQTQIDHASTQSGIAWASQPGMIRTFTGQGNLANAYKLYSDGDMASNTLKIASIPNDWSAKSAEYVDLNAPMKDGTGNLSYPIIDASALDLDPNESGFWVESVPSPTTDQPIPMPVKWLYILADGSVITPTAETSTTVRVAGASKSNPIIGRIAFWTDDETAKLNINTAAHGKFWDIPRAFSVEERDRMARFQPALYEFQRYPGHPATTSLWPAFGQKFRSISDPEERDLAFSNFIYDIIPRVEPGGSNGGTEIATAPIDLDGDRLYSSVDELLFSMEKSNDERAANPKTSSGITLNRSDIEQTKFFLTARSNAPEINLFNLPRISIWPIHAIEGNRSTLDKLIAFSSTVNTQPYYLQRSNPDSSTDEFSPGSRNSSLRNYLYAMQSQPIPGFGSATFKSKYGENEIKQISIEIFDYIRSANLYSKALGATPYTGGTTTDAIATRGTKAGQLVPLQLDGTKGIGRIPILSKAIFQLFVSGAKSTSPDGDTFEFLPGVPGKLPGLDADNPDFRTFLDNTKVDGEVDLLTSGIIYFDVFDPMYGYAFPRYKYEIDVEFSGAWTLSGPGGSYNLGFTNSSLTIDRDMLGGLYNSGDNNAPAIWAGRYLGGLLGPNAIMANYTSILGNPNNTTVSGGRRNAPYPLVSARVPIHTTFKLIPTNSSNPASPPTLPDSNTISDTITFSGGKVIAKLKVGSELVQTYTFDFPGFTKPAPIYAPRTYTTSSGTIRKYFRSDSRDLSLLVERQFPVSTDFRNRWNTLPHTHSFRSATEIDKPDIGLLQLGDVVVSLEPAYGDKRLIAAKSILTTDASFTQGSAAHGQFVPNRFYSDSSTRRAADIRGVEPYNQARKDWDEILGRKAGRILNQAYGMNAMPDVPSLYADGVEQTTNGKFWPDFDNGTLHMPDDAYVNRPDEGSSYDDIEGTATGRNVAWYNTDSTKDRIDASQREFFYSPNRQMSSAVMFGSLPVGTTKDQPWQTLLFRPDPGGRTSSAVHPGSLAPADWLMLDSFWMPVVEPYAISEPFSTNGKVNMNYEIVPFRYIHRSTALRGVLQTEELVTIGNDEAYGGAIDPTTGYGKGGHRDGDIYKVHSEGNTAAGGSISDHSFRRKLNLSEQNGTLRAFENKFAQDKIFISETEICSLHLIPIDQIWDGVSNFEKVYWDNHRITGDNSREMPYSHILPRLTTRSNTYTVHFRVQSLKKSRSGAVDIWDEERDQVTSERRGSRIIERYIDPQDNRIPDYATSDPLSMPPLTNFYRWRVIANRNFAP